MIALWVTHTLWTGVLLLLAALLLERCARGVRLPLRWVWVAALVATLGLAGWSAYSATRPTAVASVPATMLLPKTTDAADATSLATLLDAARVRFHSAIDAPATLVREHVSSALVRRASAVFAAGWLAATFALGGIVLLTLLRDRRARRSWPIDEVAGERARVAPAAGPAVVGLVHPEIVVPRWLLRAPAAQQRMVVAHEASHLRARDNLPLALSGLALVLLPWHPAVWWMAARLRLAVELDCDARVIRAGAPVRRYGDMLVDMAARRAALPLGSVALAETTSHLERRIVAMTETTPRRAFARAIVPAAIAGLLALAACEADLPTAAELDAMDVAGIEEKVTPVMVRDDLEPLYLIDGEEVDAATAHALAPEQIATVNIHRYTAVADGAGGRPEIHIITRDGARAGGGQLAEVKRADAVSFRARVDSDPLAVAGPEKFSGLLYIDGERVDAAALNALTPDRIERIEVLKGAAAARLYSEPEAANGVIQIFTKKGGAP